MPRRAISWLFVLSALVVGGFAAKESFKNFQLKKEFTELKNHYGFLPIEHADQYHIASGRNDTTGHEFVWRMYCPENCWFNQIETNAFGRITSFSESPGRHYIIPQSKKAEYDAKYSSDPFTAFDGIAIIKTPAQKIAVRLVVDKEKVRESLHKRLKDFLLEHWDDLEAIPFRSDGQSPIDLSEPFTLFELRVPKELHAALDKIGEQPIPAKTPVSSGGGTYNSKQEVERQQEYLLWQICVLKSQAIFSMKIQKTEKIFQGAKLLSSLYNHELIEFKKWKEQHKLSKVHK